MILDTATNMTLRPMKYPAFYERFREALRNTWVVEEVSFGRDLADLRERLSPAERHMIKRLVAFFATGDNIVANNLALAMYRHLNSPEARMYLSRQLAEEAVHIQFYLTLLDAYIPDMDERHGMFRALESVPSIKRKADFCFRWTDAACFITALHDDAQRREFLLNLIAYGAAVEGLFFFAAFAYVYFMRSRGLLNGLASGTDWVFRDESCHLGFAAEAVRIIRTEAPHLFDQNLEERVNTMMREAVLCESEFASDLLQGGIPGLPLSDMRQYIRYVADRRLEMMGFAPMYNVANPLSFMDLQDVQALSNFFERPVSDYQVGVAGGLRFDEEF